MINAIPTVRSSFKQDGVNSGIHSVCQENTHTSAQSGYLCTTAQAREHEKWLFGIFNVTKGHT